MKVYSRGNTLSYTINISALRPVVYALVLITTMALAAVRAAAQTPVTQLSTIGDPGTTYIGGAYIAGNGRGGCSNGDFTLLDARFDYSTGSPRIISFAARFQQQCGGTLRGLILFGSLPPAPGPQTPSITSAGFNHGKLTVRGDNFNAQCTLLVDGHQVTIDPRDPKNKLGPVIRVRGVSLQRGTHSIQVTNVDGEVSAPFSLDV